MSKKTKKLALKKENLRNLSAAELGQVNGGWYNWDYYLYKMPVVGTKGCTTDGLFMYNIYIY